MATQREVADHLDLSVKRVSELIRDGILPSKKGRSPLNIDVCRIAYISYLRKLSGYNKRGGTGDIAEEKARLTKAQADAAELKVSELEGELIPAKLVEDTWTEVASVIRVKVLGLASKISHLVLGAKTYQDIEVIINEQAYEILNELAESNGIPKEYAERAEQHNANTKTTTEIND
jgi:phage terminase Nu1 subunit (DNA packaging protein)